MERRRTSPVGRADQRRRTSPSPTTVSVERETSERLDRLVGRFGRSKDEVIQAGLDCLEQKLRPLPAEAA